MSNVMLVINKIDTFYNTDTVNCFSIALKKLNKFNLSAETAETQFEDFTARINFHFY